MSKWNELDSLELNGFKAFLKTEVMDGEKRTAIYELSKGDYKTGFRHCRGLFEDLEFLTSNHMIDTNSYELADYPGEYNAYKVLAEKRA